MNLAVRDEFIKASPAIQMESRITHLQRRAWNVLLANAYDELPNKDTHRVSMVELGLKLGFESGNMDYLKEILEGLVDCTVKWNILEKDKEIEWGVASLLANAKIREGICTYSFAPELRYKLYNPRIYAKLSLRLQNKFKSRYALILWEICFDYFDRARQEGETPFIPLERFKILMGLNKDDYPDFKVLNRNIIKVSIKEINDLTNYYVEVEQKRIGRKIAELKFRISKLIQLQSPEQIQDSSLSDFDDLSPITIKLLQAGISKKEALKIAKQEWDFVYPAVLPSSDTYPDFEAYVDEKIWIARRADFVENLAGFIIQAIKENYQDAKLQKKREAEKEREQQAMLESLKEEMEEKRRVLLRQAVRENPELIDQAAAKISSWLASDRLKDYDSAAQAYEAGGIVTAEINYILAEEFCADLIAPVLQAYEDEKAKILGKG